jgi:signal transduction histidine kinase
MDDNIESLKLEMEKRKNIFLVFKEAIYNAAKYSGCTEIGIKIFKRANQLHLQITDNGKGFDLQNIQTKNGNGIPNMKARAKEINGVVEISSVMNQGTTIHLQVPVS